MAKRLGMMTPPTRMGSNRSVRSSGARLVDTDRWAVVRSDGAKAAPAATEGRTGALPDEGVAPSIMRCIILVPCLLASKILSRVCFQMVAERLTGHAARNPGSMWPRYCRERPGAGRCLRHQQGDLVNLTRDLAAHWALRGIRVKALAPGYFESQMTARFFRAVPPSTGFEGRRRWAVRDRPGSSTARSSSLRPTRAPR